MTETTTDTRTGLPVSLLHDRAAGALVGLAAGDALGAGYEMTTPAADADVRMIGGGLGDFAPGEWTDDTSQAVAVARGLSPGALDATTIGRGLLAWFAGDPPDCGISTRSVLLGADGDATRLPGSARAYFERHPRSSAGNGALMRTSPVALAFLGDDDAIAAAAREVAEITHADSLAGDGCVLWCIGIDRAVREGRLDGVHEGLELLPPQRRDRWADALDEAEAAPPRSLRGNGFVVRAVQAAHAAIHQTPVPEEEPETHLVEALRNAVRIGGDTDTVAAIAGQLLGAAWGASAVPGEWRTMLHGWPGLDADDLTDLAVGLLDAPPDPTRR